MAFTVWYTFLSLKDTKQAKHDIWMCLFPECIWSNEPIHCTNDSKCESSLRFYASWIIILSTSMAATLSATSCCLPLGVSISTVMSATRFGSSTSAESASLLRLSKSSILDWRGKRGVDLRRRSQKRKHSILSTRDSGSWVSKNSKKSSETSKHRYYSEWGIRADPSYGT